VNDPESYTRLQVPGLPGVFFKDQRLELAGRTLRLYSASALDVLGARAGSPGQYWPVAWPAGLGLARYLAGRALRGQRVLEVGSGVAVSGLGAALAGAEVLVTDNEPPALRLARMNARRNDLPLRAAVADWRAWPLRGQFDCVIGSDVTYEPAAFDALLDVLRASLRPAGEVLLTDPGRLTSPAFLHRANQAGWTCRTEPLPHEGPQAVFLYRLRSPGS
jgi:predicted nicotinamide N-methyase